MLALMLLVASASGCSEPTCDDTDRDLYGPHCALGADCDPDNPTRNVDCEAVPPPDCDASPESPGCPCFAGTYAHCYGGPAATEDIGICKAGTAFCIHGFYGLCTGAVSPGLETCNGIDDNCDGRSDEYVTSPCGGCDSSCSGAVWGAGGAPFVITAGLASSGQGGVTLDSVPSTFDGVWITNDGDDTVSHISAATATEVGRHSSAGVEPSRVGVDYRGDVFVANTAPGAQGSLTKLGGTTAGCVDRNGINGIETSTGPLDVPSVASDECVVFNVPVGAVGEMPRALAVDGSFEPGGGGGGDPWVGLYEGAAVVHLDGATGAFIERIELPGFKPFAAAFDDRGALWFASQEGELVRVDRSTSPPTIERILVNLACYSIYDIAIAGDGAVLASGFGCDQLFRLDPHDRHLTRLATPQSPRGIAADVGLAFTAHADGRLSIVTDDLRTSAAIVDSWTMGLMPIESIGVATDALGYVWVISAQGGSGGGGVATRIDPVSAAVLGHVSVGHDPHTLGDATGRGQRGAFAPTGTTSTIVLGCGGTGNTSWQAIHVDLDAGALSRATIDIRWATTTLDLAMAQFATVFVSPNDPTSIPLTNIPAGGQIELRLTLDSDSRDSAPLVRQVGVQYQCAIE